MPDELSERADALVARIALGDREAFAALYQDHRATVYRFAVHMSGSPAVAEDVAQDVFLAVIRCAASYRPDRSGVVPWLLGIAANHVRRWRHRRQFVPLPDEGSYEGRGLVLAADPTVDVARQERDAALARALLTLPPKFREAIVLCDLQELSYDAAAAALGCAVGTVRSRLHRGRARLARAIDAPENAGQVAGWLIG